MTEIWTFPYILNFLYNFIVETYNRLEKLNKMYCILMHNMNMELETNLEGCVILDVRIDPPSVNSFQSPLLLPYHEIALTML